MGKPHAFVTSGYAFVVNTDVMLVLGLGNWVTSVCEDGGWGRGCLGQEGGVVRENVYVEGEQGSGVARV